MNKRSTYILIAVIATIAVGLWLWLNQPISNAPVGGTSPQGGDDTASINRDLNGIIIEDPDFKSVDDDLNSL